MLVNEEERLKRLLALISDDTITDPIAELRKEVKAAFEAKQQAAREAALDAVYKISRVELRREYNEALNELRSHIDTVEVIHVTAKDLPAWAREHGVHLNDLIDVLQGNRLEVTGKGKTYRSFYGMSKRLPTQEEIEQRKQDALEDERERQASERRDKLRAQSSKPVVPQLSFWKGNR